MKKLALFLAVLLCLSPALTAAARAEDGVSQSGQVVSLALGQMGYTEAEGELTLFGEAYGIPDGYWCDMFVAWCAAEAGVAEEAFPRSASCGQTYRDFSAMGRYQSSAARGGSYVPRQGDLAIFRSLRSGTIIHIGLVLYVEDGQVFTIEGNALTNRLDYPALQVSEARRSRLEPPDYVTVNVYPLDAQQIHGYAVPDYASREPLALEGFVDLGRYEEYRGEIEAVTAAGLLAGTSSHTFSPRAGLARGAFVEAAVDLCGLTDYPPDTPAYSDVPKGGRYYEAVMTARAAGLLPESETETFDPDRWISGEEARGILSKVLERLGLEDRTFSLTDGDLSMILTPYTARGDLARALYAVWIRQEDITVATERYRGALRRNGKTLDLPARSLDGVCYVSLPALMERFPGLSTSSARRIQAMSEKETADGMAVRRVLTLKAGGKALRVRGFVWNGAVYVPLTETAELLGVTIKGTR